MVKIIIIVIIVIFIVFFNYKQRYSEIGLNIVRFLQSVAQPLLVLELAPDT